MDFTKDQRKCGSCRDWKGPREKLENGCTRVKASAKGTCERLQMIKNAQGGCKYWKYCWDEEEAEENLTAPSAEKNVAAPSVEGLMVTPIVVPRFGRFLIGQQRKHITISQWIKKNGETVEKGELMVIIETSKASLELEAPASGILFCLKEDGQLVKLDETMGVVADNMEALEAYKAKIQSV